MKKIDFPLYFALLFFFLIGCSSPSIKDFKKEGESITRNLVFRLEKIHSREDLSEALPDLKYLFNELVSLIIEAKEFQRNHAELEKEPYENKQIWTKKLREELIRIYKIDGGKQLMEFAQNDSLYRLSAFENSFNKLKKQKKI